MTPPYLGPVSLGTSKYASANWKADFTTFPSAVTSHTATSKAVATKEQIAAAGIEQPASSSEMLPVANSDAELAIAQNNHLKEELDQHAIVYADSLAFTVANTRRLLILVRESLQNGSSTPVQALQATNKLWETLEVFFKEVEKAWKALPWFMERQKENMSLYHNSMLHETMKDTQEELNLQHKKINIQHELILEHQQSYQDYKGKTEQKLKEIGELSERISRLGLEKGLLKTELDNYKKQLEDANAVNDTNTMATDKLCKEFGALKVTNEDLGRENAMLRKQAEDLKLSWKKEQQVLVEGHEIEIAQLNAKLDKELQKYARLESQVETLQSGDQALRKEKKVLESELKLVQEKYQDQAKEYSQVFMNFNKEVKKSSALNNEVTRLQNEVLQINELEKSNAHLSTTMKDLEAEVQRSKHELLDSNVKVTKAVEEVKDLKKVNKKLERENEELETEVNDLSLQIVDFKKASASVPTLQQQIKELETSVADLKNKSSADKDAAGDSATGASGDSNAEAALRADVEQWKKLAELSYKEYKDMVPTFEQAEKYRQGCIDRDNEIARLQRELEKNASGQTNGTSEETNAKYWRDKYNSLLVSF